MSERFHRCGIVIAVTAGMALTGCYGRAKSVAPGDTGQQGGGSTAGQNPGDTRENTPVPAPGNSQSTPNNSPKQ